MRPGPARYATLCRAEEANGHFGEAEILQFGEAEILQFSKARMCNSFASSAGSKWLRKGSPAPATRAVSARRSGAKVSGGSQQSNTISDAGTPQ